ncbi:MAG: membrane protein insertase YidC [Simkaniaceae bacterium]
MDKRTIIFLFFLVISFYVIQNFFSGKNEERLKETLAQKKATEEYQEARKEGNLNIRPLSLNQLSIVSLYKDSDRRELSAKAYFIKDNYLAFSSDETLYTQDGKKITASINGDHKRPSLFSSSQNPKLPSTYLPQIGVSSLQFLTLGEDTPSVTVGNYVDTDVFFPNTPPSGDALALYELNGQYLPVGYYLAEKKEFIDLPSDHTFNKLISMQSSDIQSLEANETFYVLETPTQQIVFSNIGGSIVEINLPFQSKENQESIVRPIGFDRTIEKEYPSQDLFPNAPYYVIDQSGNQVLQNPTKGGYYPLVRRSIQGTSKENSFVVSPRFYSTAILSDDPEMESLRYNVKSFTDKEIVFEASMRNRRIIKTYKLPEERIFVPYTLELSIRVDGDSRGLWLATGIPEVELISNSFTPALKYRTSFGKKPQVEKVSLPKKESNTFSHIQPDWISNSNGFFTLLIDPLEKAQGGLKAEVIPGNFDPTRISVIDKEYDLYPPSKYNGYNLLLPLENSSRLQNYRLFAGPLERDVLKKVDAIYSDPVTQYNPYYISAISFHGWLSFISEPFAKFLFLLMNLFYSMTHSWGFSIILLTVALRFMLYPLNAWSIKSNLKMQKIAPKVTALQKKYKNDGTRAQLETMQLYKECGVNPFSGCLPLLIQMPFLIGMFDLLKSSFDLRGAPFIPGWINNLTAPDVLFTWSYPIIFIGNEFHLLPILLGATMFLQQRWMQAKNKGAPQTDQQKQTQTMGNMMTIVFTVMFYRFPSGLNLYWISSMLLNVLQQAYMNRRYKDEPLKKKIKT